MRALLAQRAPLEPLRLDWLEAAGVEAAILRLDLLDPLISGNKAFKLLHHLDAARARGTIGLLGVGGPHSNHLHALAAACRREGLGCVGLLRGEPRSTPTVADLEAMGMRLHWLSHGQYRERHDASFWAPWLEQYANFYPVPEGGGGLPGALGCRLIHEQILGQLPLLGWQAYDQLWTAVGSGTTLAGLQLALADGVELVGALAVPSRYGVDRQVEALLDEAGCLARNYRLLDACQGGFGRCSASLLAFVEACERASGVPLEPIYLGKLLWALRERVTAGYLAAGSRLVLIHGGGLQDRRAALSITRSVTELMSS